MRTDKKTWILILILMGTGILLCPLNTMAQAPSLPNLTIGLGQTDNPEQVSTLLQILLLLTVLTLAPAIVIMMTSFTRLAIVFSLVRTALGTQQMPPNQIIIGLALLLTFFIMTPVFNDINNNALKPYLAEEISQEAAMEKAVKPIRAFMLKQTRKKDIALFIDIAKLNKPSSYDEIPTIVLISSFVVSELKTAFQIGFVIYIPFLL
jgi:flagellar biosynthetic protein FliP